ncbi:purine-cytosine permease family protein [Georgenia thermotolerans]|uniref:Allantoin permease n=1 Tax=Georgenia thermotolerans TaxID=527326 RepID=A0A7J5UMJ7_9MICO|nr:cytosine permease [Georgenia thermotolerans]KAE8763608.1 allantoin permease [Georgenia thermotolerans]
MTDRTLSQEGPSSAFTIEATGIEVIADADRKGRPASLFWPWFAANISVFGISYGSWILDFGISFAQATLVAVVGTVLSFLLVGIIALAGKRGSAPTLTLSRAAFGVRGNLLPGVVSYLLLVGWEIVLVALATLATDTVIQQLGWSGGNTARIIAFLVVIAIVVGAGILGFDMIMRVQTVLTIVLGVVTLGYIALTVDQIDLAALGQLPAGSWEAVLGALMLVMTALGLGWVNAAADYSRYLPRAASSGGVVFWTTFGASLAPVVLIVYGLLLVGSNPDLSAGISSDPIGTLATLLPTWYLVPFVLVAVGGLVSGAVLDIYSSGLTLLAVGVRVPRWVAAAIDGLLMVVGTIVIVWFAADFFGPFQGFLITLGVPIAAWAGIFIGDLLLRRRDYDTFSLFDARGVYGAVNWLNVVGMLALTAIGWGLVTNGVQGLTWQGYLFGPLGLDVDTWGFSGVGVAVALFGGLVVGLANAGRIRRQEAATVTAPEPAVVAGE